MTKLISLSAFALTVALPSLASAHGQYLAAVSDYVDNNVAQTPCALPGETCGLCHQPLEGDRLENVTVDNDGIDQMDRNGPFYDSLNTGDGGWNHLPHAMDGNAHRDMNLMNLNDNVLPAILAASTDSDGDGVSDLEELSLGYNPLLAYEADDAERSQLCGAAGEFPMVGGTGSTGGDESTGGDDMPGDDTAGDDTGTDPDDSGGDDMPGDDMPGDDGPGDDSPGDDAMGDETGASATGGTGGGGADGDDDSSGCRVGGAGGTGGALALLLLAGVALRRRD